MTRVLLTTDIEAAKHGCDAWDEENDALFRKFSGVLVTIHSITEVPSHFKCGTDVCFRILIDGDPEQGYTVCRHQIQAGD